MYAGKAGWYGAKELRIPENVMLRPRPSYSPELNPVERIRLYLKERYPSHRRLDDYDAIVGLVPLPWILPSRQTRRQPTGAGLPAPARSLLLLAAFPN